MHLPQAKKIFLHNPSIYFRNLLRGTNLKDRNCLIADSISHHGRENCFTRRLVTNTRRGREKHASLNKDRV